ncbi:pseudouridylate synthase 1 homolog [Mya arenaria]|uniref:pseudouridylate synthase 1 homolog n=1 Tax=Mya arenaria TaxID=6604 RepID=UPI0022E8DAC1|nr:pseudouridylate synthase 1 homolog [Mya arenaria]
MIKRVFKRLQEYIKVSMSVIKEAQQLPGPGDKRGADGTKKEGSDFREERKRKVALVIAYSGKGYFGLQMNSGFKTIEGEVLRALLDVGVIPQDHYDSVWKMSFQRAARTDKGVSAAGNVLSLKIGVNMPDLLDRINEKLPEEIRAMDIIRTTKGFNSKNHCTGRTYNYLLPTLAFSPVEENATFAYRTNLETIEKVNEILEKYKGTHNFHNFTSGVKPHEATAYRHMWNVECGLPFVRDGVEFCVLSVSGQSFMMHQIRKMVGLMIAIIRGFAGENAVERAWESEKMDIPKAPGLGLFLDRLHYSQYNTKFANDGSHPKIEFSKIKDKLQAFKEEKIFTEIIKTEVEENSMIQWLGTLHLHTCEDVGPDIIGRRDFKERVEEHREQAEAEANDSDNEHTETKNTKESSETVSESQVVKETTEGTATGHSKANDCTSDQGQVRTNSATVNQSSDCEGHVIDTTNQNTDCEDHVTSVKDKCEAIDDTSKEDKDGLKEIVKSVSS